MPKLSIKSFQSGQTSSPYQTDGAFWKSANLDIFGQEGIARINYQPTGITDSVNNLVRTGFGRSDKTYFSQVVTSSDNGCAKYLDTTTMTVGDLGATKRYLDSITYWKGYLIGTPSVSRAAIVTSADNYDLSANKIGLGTNQAWSQIGEGIFQQSSTRPNLKIMTSLGDGFVYYTNSYYVGQLKEDTTFDPTDGSTYTNNPNHMAHPFNFYCQSIEDFGRFIAVFATDEIAKRTVIFIWDPITPGVESQFVIPEANMSRTLEYQGNIFIAGGNQGNIYLLSESGLRKYAQIKVDDYDNRNYLHKDLVFNSMAWWKDRLMVGVDFKDSSTLTPAGIYSVKDGRVNHEFIPSNGLTDHTLKLGGMFSFDDYLFYGAGSSTYRLDYVRDDNNRLQTGTYLETPLLRAGYKMQKGSIDRVEVILARPLQTGESFTIKYRRNINDTYTTLGTKSYTTDGGHSSYLLDGIKNIENIQLKIELGTGASSKNTPMISEITLF